MLAPLARSRWASPFRLPSVHLAEQDEGGAPLAGFERRQMIMMDVNGTRLPLRWNSTTAEQRQAAVGKRVRLRLFFRDATIYAVGSLAVSG